MKKESGIIMIIILILAIILIWGFVGKQVINKPAKICDFGLMEELDFGGVNGYLCWVWHESSSLNLGISNNVGDEIDGLIE